MVYCDLDIWVILICGERSQSTSKTPQRQPKWTSEVQNTYYETLGGLREQLVSSVTHIQEVIRCVTEEDVCSSETEVERESGEDIWQKGISAITDLVTAYNTVISIQYSCYPPPPIIRP